MRLRQPYSEIKFEAKQILLQNGRICTMITLAAGLFYLAVLLIQSNYAVGFLLEVLEATADETLSVFSFGAGGLSLVLRLEDMGVVAKVSATVPQLTGIVIMQLFSVVLTAPAIFGARALFCRISDGDKIETADLKGIFKWYTDLALAGRAILLYGIVSVLEWVFQILSAGIALFYFFPGAASETAFAGSPILSFAVTAAALCILLLGFLFTWSLLPAGWLMARHPELSPAEALRRGRTLLRGWVTDHFIFRLSFVLWFLCSIFTYHALLLFLFPYYQIAEACYLKRLEAEKALKIPPIL